MSPLIPSYLRVGVMQNYYIGCAICGKPLRLEAARTEHGDLPVHEECYLLRLKEAAKPPQKEHDISDHGPVTLTA